MIGGLAKKSTFVNHYSFHIMDSRWGHLTIKMAGHPPFAAQVILNGHEYVAVAAQAAGIAFTKEGNCFTGTTDPRGLAQIADTLSQDAAIGRLGQVMRPVDLFRVLDASAWTWPISSGQRFRYAYSVFQAEYTRNLMFACGASDGPGVQRRSRTGPGPGWTSRPCGPCSGSRSARQAGTAEPSPRDWES